EVFPIHHAFTQRAILVFPPSGGLFPAKVLDGNHLQARQDDVGRDLPAAHAALGHRMTGVEIEAGPLRIERPDHRSYIPDWRSDILLVVVIANLDAVPLAERHETAERGRGLLELATHIDQFVLVIARFIKS